MPNRDTLKLLEDSVKEILEPQGFVLVELKSIRTSPSLTLRFLIDRQEGAITLGECTQLNNQIGQLLDGKNIFNDKYILEVSSPGLDRPLVKPQDYRRALNERIHIFLKEAQDGKLEFEGKLISLNNDGLFIVDDENREVFILFSKINKAKRMVL